MFFKGISKDLYNKIPMV